MISEYCRAVLNMCTPTRTLTLIKRSVILQGCCGVRKLHLSRKQRFNGCVLARSNKMKNLPEDGVKVAREVAEELREETGVQLDSEAWQEKPADAGPPEKPSVWYFAFGSNMNKSVLEGRRMVKPAESQPAILHGYCLAFNMPGMPYREPAFAGAEKILRSEIAANNGSLLQKDGNGNGANHKAEAQNDTRDKQLQEVHGVVHHITDAQWNYVLETEGAVGHTDYGYGVEEVTVETYDGRSLQAFTLVSQPNSVAFLKGREALPSLRYLKLLREGAAEHGLTPSYQQFLQDLQPYQTVTVGQRVGSIVMLVLFISMVSPVFLSQKVYAKVTGMSASKGGGGIRGKFIARYLHSVFALVWLLHDTVEPLLGCGCSAANRALSKKKH